MSHRPAATHHPAMPRLRLPRVTASRLALLATATALAAPGPAVAQSTTTRREWVSSWTASPEATWGGRVPLPTGVPFHLWKQTVRQVIRVSVGGPRVRIVLSNAYGTRPLRIGAAHVAVADTGSAIIPGTDRALTFGGASTVTIPPGAPVISDPVSLPAPALTRLAVSLFLPEPSPISAFHWDGGQTAYIAAGNRVGDRRLDADTTLTAQLYLSSVLVAAPSSTRVVVGYGDSITDGAGATHNAFHRWTDYLASRLAADDVAVLNASNSGGRLLSDGMGQNGLARFERDVLGQPHVRTVILLMGINDISWPGHVFAPDERPVTAQQLIAGYQQLIARAHARNVRIIGGTLTPFEGALDRTPLAGYYTAEKDSLRQAVNHWIRTSGAFDAVIDFDALIRDPRHPSRMLPAYDSGDHLHPGDAGNKVMADAIDRAALFGR